MTALHSVIDTEEQSWAVDPMWEVSDVSAGGTAPLYPGMETFIITWQEKNHQPLPI